MKNGYILYEHIKTNRIKSITDQKIQLYSVLCNWSTFQAKNEEKFDVLITSIADPDLDFRD
jgi:hypothetical protein